MRTWTYHHQCATCEFWGGEREVQRDPRAVEYSGLGFCTSPKKNNRTEKITGGTSKTGCWVCWSCLEE